MSDQVAMTRTPTPIQDGKIQVRDTTDLKGLAEYYYKSNLMSQCKSPEQAFVLCATALELKIGFMQAITGIAVINGKPVLHSKLPMALVLRTGELESMTEDIFDRNPDGSIGLQSKAVCVVKRRGQLPIHGDFSMADAKAAGLLGKEVWKAYPADMLKARARSRALGVAFADALLGMGIDTDGDGFEQDRPRQVVVNQAPSLPPSPAASKLDAIIDEPLEGAAGESGTGSIPGAPSAGSPLDVEAIAAAMDAEPVKPKKPKPVFDLAGNPVEV